MASTCYVCAEKSEEYRTVCTSCLNRAIAERDARLLRHIQLFAEEKKISKRLRQQVHVVLKEQKAEANTPQKGDQNDLGVKDDDNTLASRDTEDRGASLRPEAELDEEEREEWMLARENERLAALLATKRRLLEEKQVHLAERRDQLTQRRTQLGILHECVKMVPGASVERQRVLHLSKQKWTLSLLEIRLGRARRDLLRCLLSFFPLNPAGEWTHRIVNVEMTNDARRFIHADDAEGVAVGLGYCVQLLLIACHYLGTHIPHRMHFLGSRSSIIRCEDNERFALYFVEDTTIIAFTEALRLLNENVSVFCSVLGFPLRVDKEALKYVDESHVIEWRQHQTLPNLLTTFRLSDLGNAPYTREQQQQQQQQQQEHTRVGEEKRLVQQHSVVGDDDEETQRDDLAHRNLLLQTDVLANVEEKDITVLTTHTNGDNVVLLNATTLSTQQEEDKIEDDFVMMDAM